VQNASRHQCTERIEMTEACRPTRLLKFHNPTIKRGLSYYDLSSRPVPPRCTKCNSPRSVPKGRCQRESSPRLLVFVIEKLIYILIHQKMIAIKQIGKNKKLDSEHNIENTVTYTPT